MPPELRRTQHEAIAFLRARPRAGLFDDAGMGKSACALLAATEPVLVAAPAYLLATGTWRDEQRLWAPDLDVTYVPYSQLSRRMTTEKGGSAPTGSLKADLGGHWGTVVLDECHHLRNRKAKWTMCTWELKADNIWGMSGTPIVNWAQDLWSFLKLLRPKDPAIRSYWRWVETWFDVKPSRWNSRARDVGNLIDCDCNDPGCKHWAEFMEQNLGGLVLRRTLDEGDLPPVVPVEYEVEMSKPQRKVYDTLRKSYIAFTPSGHEIRADSKAAQVTLLRRISLGLGAVDPAATKDNPKVDAMVQRIVDDGHPALVFAHFRSAVELTTQRLCQAGLAAGFIHGGVDMGHRATVVQAFKDGQYDVLVASVETLAEGVTLTRARAVHFLEKAWTPSKNYQAYKRAHRWGQTHPVLVYTWLTASSIDANVQRVVAGKTDHQARAMTAIEMLDLA